MYGSKIGFTIRSAKHEVTSLTRNFINFGRELTLDGNCDKYVPSDTKFSELDLGNRKLTFARIYKNVQAKLSKAYNRNKPQYNLRRRPDKLSLNQKVWRRSHAQSDAAKNFSAKLAPKFVGPFTISKIVSPWTYKLKGRNGKGTEWHIKDLKTYHPYLD
ncbi:hypothetical protein NQ314_002366 [Rhamnusium bicolor]|uniref:Uncharacterized protein n=1 Tax=Rhamnusium bicolor TaxID=1586634 RepID=A0AAV8ZSD2_9CUCU|nr:hypothetical protein NQ314_002366 [Rhamnusium bicolor]